VEKRFTRPKLREMFENRTGTRVEPCSLEELANNLGGFESFMSVLKTGRLEQNTQNA